VGLALVASACAARYPARGLVLKVDRATSTLTISHEEIPGYMDAMVMPFTVRDPADVDDVRPGDRIAFRLNVRKDRTQIDRVQLLSAAPADPGLLNSPAASTLVKIGEPFPDFTLTNQDGRPVSLSSLRGKVVANLQAVERRFPEHVNKDLALVAVTFDPKFDTPERLKEYAEFFKSDKPGWQFLTGSLDDITRVTQLFGVEFWPEEGLITHTLQTAVIDRDGKLAAQAEGKDYSGKQLADLVGLTLGRD
jgi:protein SCO1/2